MGIEDIFKKPEFKSMLRRIVNGEEGVLEEGIHDFYGLEKSNGLVPTIIHGGKKYDIPNDYIDLVESILTKRYNRNSLRYDSLDSDIKKYSHIRFGTLPEIALKAINLVSEGLIISGAFCATLNFLNVLYNNPTIENIVGFSIDVGVVWLGNKGIELYDRIKHKIHNDKLKLLPSLSEFYSLVDGLNRTEGIIMSQKEEYSHYLN